MMGIMPAGRPSTYTPEIARRICACIANGFSLVDACRFKGMPDRATAYRWQEAHPEFAAQYASAREMQAELVDHQVMDTIRKVASGKMPPDVGRVVLGGLQWRARVLNPSAYGDQMAVKHSGNLGFNLTIIPRAQPKLVEDHGGDVIAIHPRRLNGKDAAEPH